MISEGRGSALRRLMPSGLTLRKKKEAALNTNAGDVRILLEIGGS